MSNLKDVIQQKSRKITSIFEEKNTIGATLDNLIRGKLQKEFEIWYNAMKKLYEVLKNYNSNKIDVNPSSSISGFSNRTLQNNLTTHDNDILNSSSLSSKKQKTEDLMKNVINNK